MRHTFCLLAALVLLAAPAAVAQDAGLQREMADYFDRVNAAMTRSDADGLAALWTDDAEYRDLSQLNASGRDSLRVMFEGMLAERGPAPPFRLEPGSEAIPLGEFVYARGVYSLVPPGREPVRVGFSGLMRRTADGLVAHRLTEFPAEPPPAEAADVRPTVAHLVYEALEAEGIEAARARHAALRAAAPAYVRFAEDDLNALGYRLVERGSVPEAVAVFEMNTEAYPDAPNVHDSLGEGLAAAGRGDEARAAFARAVALAEAQGDPRLPTFRANLDRAARPAEGPR